MVDASASSTDGSPYRFESDIPHHESRPVDGRLIKSPREVLQISEIEYRKEPVRGYEEYSIDTDGVVYSKRGRPLKPSTNWRGYSIVNLLKDGIRKGFAVHTLVANQFLQKDCANKTQVNHKDGVKTNNSVINLEWVTPLENTRHSIEVLGFDARGSNNHMAKALIALDKRTGEMIHEFGSLSDAAQFIEASFNVKKNTAQCGIWKSIYGYKKSYKGFIWRYI